MAELTQVAVPDIGDFSDVEVIEILVKAGSTVAVEEPLVTLESDKATMDIPSPVAGTVRENLVAVGDRVSEGIAVCMVEASATESADTSADTPSEPASKPATESTASTAPAAAPIPANDVSAGDVDLRPKCWFWGRVRAATPLRFVALTWACRQCWLNVTLRSAVCA